MKKVLIIGSKGMLGQELVRAFSANKKYQTIGWDLDDLDITDVSQARKKIMSLEPAIIVNATAYNAVDQAEEVAGLEIARKINGLAPGYLSIIAKNLEAIFVHYSSDYVFDGQKEAGYAENDEPSPISNYGFSKRMGEQQVIFGGSHHYIIRLQKLFGRPAQSALSKKSFFEVMLSLAQAKLSLADAKKELEVVDEELANFTFAPDLAERTKYLVERNLPSGIYHITNEGNPVTWFCAAKILFKMAGIKDVKLIPVSGDKFPRPAKRPKYSILLNTKLSPMRPWDEALREFLDK